MKTIRDQGIIAISNLKWAPLFPVMARGFRSRGAPFRWTAVHFALLLLVLCVLPASASVELGPGEERLPIQSVVRAACHSKMGFMEYTNESPCRVLYYLCQTITTVTNGAFQTTQSWGAGTNSTVDTCDITDLTWGAGTDASTQNEYYGATQIQYADWNTGTVYSNYYNGLATNFLISGSNRAQTNIWSDGCTHQASYGAYTDVTNSISVVDTLSNVGWVENVTHWGTEFMFTNWPCTLLSSNCTLYWNTTNAQDPALTNGPWVMQLQYYYGGVLLYSLAPTQEIYQLPLQVHGGSGWTTQSLANEFTTTQLKSHTLDSLSGLTFDGATTYSNCPCSFSQWADLTNACCYLGDCETNIALSKYRFTYAYETETNRTYLLKKVFNVLINGAFDHTVTLSNLIAGDGLTHWETNVIYPVLSNSFTTNLSGQITTNGAIAFRLQDPHFEALGYGDPLLAQEGTNNPNCCTNCFGCYIQTDVNVDAVTFTPYGGCDSRSGTSPGNLSGPGPDLIRGVSLRFGLGQGFLGQPQGELASWTGVPTNSMWSSQGLFPLVLTNAILVTNTAGGVLQAAAPQCLVDIEPVANGYQIAFYPTNGQVPSPDHQTRLSLNGLTAFVVWTIDNPDGSGGSNRVRVTETRGAQQIVSIFTWDGVSQWTLSAGNGLAQKTFNSLWDPFHTNRTETCAVSATTQGAPILAQTVCQYQVYDLCEHPAILTNGLGSAARTGISGYYPGASPETYRGGLYQSTNGDNFAQTWVYDSEGRPSCVTWDSGHGKTRQCSYYYADTGGYSLPAGFSDNSTLWPLRPREVAISGDGSNPISYFAAQTNQTYDIRCEDTYNGNFLCITRNFYPTGDLNATRLKSVQYPDGTADLYSYSGNAGAFTITVLSGQTNANNGLSTGVETVTVLGSVGQVISRQVYDIAPDHPNGILTWQESYAYSDLINLSYVVTNLDATTETRQWPNASPGLALSVDRDGATNQYFYDGLWRLISVCQTNFGITTSNLLDAAGNTLAVVRWAGGVPITNWSAGYDSLGRPIAQTNALGGVTSYAYSLDGSGDTLITATFPYNGTRVENRNHDGSLYRLTGTATLGVQYDTGSGSSTQTRLDANGNPTSELTTTTVDMLGRVIQTELAGGQTWSKSYNPQGQLSQETDPDSVTTLYQYNSRGELEYTALDMDLDGLIGFGGTDRITRLTNNVSVGTQNPNLYVHRTVTYVWNGINSPTALCLATNETSVDGRSSWSFTQMGTSQSQKVYLPGGWRYVTNTASDGTLTVRQYQFGRLLSESLSNPSLGTLGGTSFGYDVFNRLNAVADLRNGTTSYSYNNADQITVAVTPAPGGVTGGSPETTTTVYDLCLRPCQVIQPDGASVTSVFSPSGLLQTNFGARTYPVAYTYDYAGRLQTLTTWQNFAGNSGAATTTWTYDPQTGWLQYQDYPNPATGQTNLPGTCGWEYLYTSAGRLQHLYNARGAITGFLYDNAGEVTTVTVSDQSAPSLAYTYDRLGRIISVTSTPNNGNPSTDSLSYNNADELLGESWSGGTLDKLSTSIGYDAKGRRSNLGLFYQLSALNTVNYAYDAASRLQNVSQPSSANALPVGATYSYLANCALINQVVFTNNGATRMTTSRQYDFLDRLGSITTTSSSTPPFGVSSAYAYNSANQRTRATVADGSFWLYGYDSLGQVNRGARFTAVGAPVPGQQFNYTFDNIGNRQTTGAGGDGRGSNLRPASYAVNRLNQYTSRTVPGAVDVNGLAIATNVVTVNSQNASRVGEYYEQQVTVNNTNSAVWQAVTVSATGQGSCSGNLFVPQTPENFTNDVDGNLTGDGRWSYTWDAWNRLVTMTADMPVGPQQQLVFEYDWLGRRIRKDVSVYNGGTYTLVSSRRLLYDGWNLVAEMDAMNPQPPALLRSYVWGLDLSGSLQAAGGVGGLLAVNDLATLGSLSTHVAAYDGDGNVSALVNAANGTNSAQYDYASFDEGSAAPLRASPSMPMDRANPLRFSTKYEDDETDFVYYGQRYYNPMTGRWLNRDPIGEDGGRNLLGFVGNSPLNAVDAVGTRVPRTLAEAAQSWALYLTLQQKWIQAEKVAWALVGQPGYFEAAIQAEQIGQAASLTGAELALAAKLWDKSSHDAQGRLLLPGQPEGIAGETGLPETICSDIAGAPLTDTERAYVQDSGTANLVLPVAGGITDLSADVIDFITLAAGAPKAAEGVLALGRAGVSSLSRLGKAVAVASVRRAALQSLRAWRSAAEGTVAADAANLASQPNRIYSARVLIRAGEESGPFHNFPESFNQQIFDQGTRTVTPNFWNTPRAGLSSDAVMYELPGNVNGTAGTFQIGVRPSVSGNTEVITHRFFKPN